MSEQEIDQEIEEDLEDEECNNSFRERYRQTLEISVDVHREILEMFCKGYKDTEITPVINAKYETDRVTVRRWVKKIKEMIYATHRDNKESYAKNLSIAEQRLLFVYSKAMEVNDPRTALTALKHLMELQGLITPAPSNMKDSPIPRTQNKEPDLEVSDLSKEELLKLANGGR